MTQTERVLRSLEAAGPRGVTQADWSGLHGTPDAGPPITRVAARVLELTRSGHVVEKRGKRDRCAVYVLVPQVERIVEPDLPVSLFRPPALSPYDQEAA